MKTQGRVEVEQESLDIATALTDTASSVETDLIASYGEGCTNDHRIRLTVTGIGYKCERDEEGTPTTGYSVFVEYIVRPLS